MVTAQHIVTWTPTSVLSLGYQYAEDHSVFHPADSRFVIVSSEGRRPTHYMAHC